MRRIAITLATLIASPALAQGVVPKDGSWTTRTEAVEFADTCSPAIAPMLEPMANSFRNEETQDLTFGGSFDPRKMGDTAELEGVTWTQIDANNWDGVMVNPLTGEGQVATIRLTALSETEITGAMNMDLGAMFAGEPDMAEMAPLVAGCSLDLTMRSTFNG